MEIFLVGWGIIKQFILAHGEIVKFHSKIPPESEMIKMYEPWHSTARHLNPIIVSITHLLARNKCTYDEVDQILEQLQHWIKETREQKEYATCKDYVSKNKTDCMDNVVITPYWFC